ncbi:MAG: CRISPR-associated endonuclease Cas3'' [Verrucomicrobiota bacterium]
MPFYAHTKENTDGSPAAQSEWELLFTPFGDGDKECQGKNGDSCQKCHDMDPQHGHLNKVAYWSGKFAAEMFPEEADRESARQWGYLAGLWHDLGKFSEKFQNYLTKVSDIHCDEILERIDHTSTGAKLSASKSFPLGHCISTAIAHKASLDPKCRFQRPAVG